MTGELSHQSQRERPAALIELVDPEGQLMREIADRRMKRYDVALTYAMALAQPDEVDWSMVNHAIIDRWSRSALVWIKERAWRIVERGVDG